MPTTIHVALQDALSDAVTKCQLSSSKERDAELLIELLPPSSVFELLSLPTEDWCLGTRTGQVYQQGIPNQVSPSDRSSLDRGDNGSDGSARPRLSAGKCVTRAMEAASRRLSSSLAAASAPTAAANGDGCSMDGVPTDDGSSSQLQQQQQQETTEESAHIVSLIWSTGAEAYLDGITQLVAEVLNSLDDEISRDVQAAAATTTTGDGDEGEVPMDSKAGRLLARVLSLSLEKQDVDEDGGGGEAEGAAASPLVRELYEKLESFSSTHEKLDAVKTLLLAGCYFEGVRAASTGASRG